MTIKTKFRGKQIEFENKSQIEGNIYSNWNSYQIQFRKYGKEKKILVKSPSGEILIKRNCNDMKKAISLAFENIESDISEKEYMVKESWFLMCTTNGKFANEINEAKKFLKSFSY